MMRNTLRIKFDFKLMVFAGEKGKFRTATIIPICDIIHKRLEKNFDREKSHVGRQ